MCTSIRFTDNSGHMYLGRNLDWSFDYGQQVRVMPRGFHILSVARLRLSRTNRSLRI